MTTNHHAASAIAGLAATVFVRAPVAARSPDASILTDADWRAIRTIVEAQRAALVDGDGERAFGHASPGIRRQFGDARAFVAMVRRSYSALIDARDAVLLLPESYIHVRLLTEGGPYYATFTLSQFIYEAAFDRLDFGLASAALWVLYALTGLLLVVVYVVARQWNVGTSEEDFLL